ncbi:hypothetical protein [Nocardia sp. NPDC051832]|uniref:hypothetical protein n=1 Tax=Nocardia sp. NPDC051832 TaxID=3155673 RepID=UPI003414E2FF
MASGWDWGEIGKGALTFALPVAATIMFPGVGGIVGGALANVIVQAINDDDGFTFPELGQAAVLGGLGGLGGGLVGMGAGKLIGWGAGKFGKQGLTAAMDPVKGLGNLRNPIFTMRHNYGAIQGGQTFARNYGYGGKALGSGVGTWFAQNKLQPNGAGGEASPVWLPTKIIGNGVGKLASTWV